MWIRSIFLSCELSEYVCSVMSDVSNNCKEVLKSLVVPCSISSFR